MGTIGKNVKSLRDDNGWTQRELSEIVKVSENYIGCLENGSRHPSKKLIGRLAAAFGTDPMTLEYGERKEEQPQTPEHLRLLFEMISEVFPDSMSLIQKNDVLTNVLKDLREAKTRTPA